MDWWCCSAERIELGLSGLASSQRIHNSCQISISSRQQLLVNTCIASLLCTLSSREIWTRVDKRFEVVYIQGCSGYICRSKPPQLITTKASAALPLNHIHQKYPQPGPATSTQP